MCVCMSIEKEPVYKKYWDLHILIQTHSPMTALHLTHETGSLFLGQLEQEAFGVWVGWKTLPLSQKD